MDSLSVLQRYRAEIDDELRVLFSGHRQSIYDMLRYHLGWVDEKGRPQETGGGKRLRPSLCLLCCEALGGDYRQALPAAAGIELLHNFTLIHDDIEDNDRERHHRPTVWSLWGVPRAINAGDGLHVIAHLAMLGLEQRGVPAAKVVQVATVLGEACLEICEGQDLDISFEERLDVRVEDYLQMITRKTAALMEASFRIGALLGTDDEEAVYCLALSGRKLGLAFQMRDDVLGIWGRAEDTGKVSANDIRRKKKSLPVVYTFSKARDEARKELERIYAKETLSEDDVASVLAIMEEVGAEAFAQRLAEDLLNEALGELNKVSSTSHALAELKRLAVFFVERAY